MATSARKDQWLARGVVIAGLLAACEHAPLGPGVSSASKEPVSVRKDQEEVDIAVGFRSEITPTDEDLIASVTSRSPHYWFRGFPGLIIRAPQAVARILRANARVEFAEVGVPVYPSDEPFQWHFQNPPPVGHGIQAVHDQTAFGDARYGATIGIAVVGTGINCSATSDFLPPGSAGCAGGVDFTGEGTPFNDVWNAPNGHETRVASVILSAANNGIQIKGIAPKAVVYSLRIFNSQGFGSCIWSAAAIDYATYNLSSTVSIINASYGSPAVTAGQKSSYQQNCQSEITAVANAVNSNRFISASAGNTATTGDSVIFPARLPGVAAVSGMTCSLWFGVCVGNGAVFWAGSARGSQVAFAAAATNVYTIRANNTVMQSNGTSFAAPIVSAIVAQVQSRYGLPRTGQCMLQHLKNTAYRSSGWNSVFYGAGMVNGLNAWNTTPPIGTPECTPGPT